VRITFAGPGGTQSGLSLVTEAACGWRSDGPLVAAPVDFGYSANMWGRDLGFGLRFEARE
jgi:hypothetical protein